ncbi:Os01g0716300 [Oryza sativa Japonica Group]|uniref:Os01g0716300 protein n=1 Tax=Oryza sativa subsp. japonica TaxID=39947 RepID=A0A0P0V7E8_ORYSJ|nr:Os01g0716300 [Oryza sativa Japonica Group]
MATSLFLALQCVQCSTMQVKPQKKSSNKWVCVVCNQRQSVMRVHARGHRAADLRRFVQEANLSRGRAAHVPVPEEDWVPAVPGEQRDEFPKERKRRMDWSDYLEDPGEYDGGGHHEEARDEDVGIQVTTELPEKRPKVTSLKRAPKAQLGLGGKRPKTPVTSTLPKRQPIEEGSLPFKRVVCFLQHKDQNGAIIWIQVSLKGEVGLKTLSDIAVNWNAPLLMLWWMMRYTLILCDIYVSCLGL